MKKNEKNVILEKFSFYKLRGFELLRLKFNNLIDHSLLFAIVIKLNEFINKLSDGFFFNYFIILHNFVK